jgi:hypothetical protein
MKNCPEDRTFNCSVYFRANLKKEDAFEHMKKKQKDSVEKMEEKWLLDLQQDLKMLLFNWEASYQYE